MKKFRLIPVSRVGEAAADTAGGVTLTARRKPCREETVKDSAETKAAAKARTRAGAEAEALADADRAGGKVPARVWARAPAPAGAKAPARAKARVPAKAGAKAPDRAARTISHLKRRRRMMPGYDRSGPMGMGPMTGRRMGRCGRRNTGDAQYDQDMSMGMGMGRGMGRGLGRGRGRGFGRRNMAYEPAMQYGGRDQLELEAAELRRRLEAIESRLAGPSDPVT